MNVFIINCGSSSIKFQLFRMPVEDLLIQGKVEKNGAGDSLFWFKTKKSESEAVWKGFSFSDSFQKILDELVRPKNDCLTSLDEVDIVGHRLIHGGEEGTGCAEINSERIAYMESCIALAPLHYPANLKGIRIVSALLPGKLQAGVFDTAFHSTLPPRAFLYGISLDWYKEHRIRRYGFHGTSHKYASQSAIQLTGLPAESCRLISCHLGNGVSLTAIKNGSSIDTSMGFTPVEGLLMGTRCGDIDAGVLLHLQEKFHLSAGDIQQVINKEGGLLGLSGCSSDYRAVENAALNGNESAQTALEVYHYRVKKYIGAYVAALGGLDLLVFTGGIGENSIRARQAVCSDLEFMGISLSVQLNRDMNSRQAVISTPDSRVKVVIIPANEELMIAREVAEWAGKFPEANRKQPDESILSEGT